jgi:beta-catenin-like protein 1
VPLRLLCLGPCSVLMPDENKERFVKSEGVELMIIVIRQKRQAYASAFKTLDFALTRCPSACDRFVTVQGLKTLFAAFMGKVRRRGVVIIKHGAS